MESTSKKQAVGGEASLFKKLEEMEEKIEEMEERIEELERDNILLRRENPIEKKSL